MIFPTFGGENLESMMLPKQLSEKTWKTELQGGRRAQLVEHWTSVQCGKGQGSNSRRASREFSKSSFGTASKAFLNMMIKSTFNQVGSIERFRNMQRKSLHQVDIDWNIAYVHLLFAIWVGRCVWWALRLPVRGWAGIVLISFGSHAPPSLPPWTQQDTFAIFLTNSCSFLKS